MSDKPVTIRDVAQRAGVSESTVSRVLSGAETAIQISDETRERVLEATQELAYRPHPGAQSLRGKSTHLLGLIVREIDDPFFAQLIEAIGNVANEKGYDLVLGYAKSDPEEALALSAMMLDLRYCDGLFLLGDLKESPKDHTFLARMGGGTGWSPWGGAASSSWAIPPPLASTTARERLWRSTTWLNWGIGGSATSAPGG